MKSMEDVKFLTFEETKARLGKSDQGIHYLAQQGKLKRYKRGIGNETFFNESEVEELMRIREAA